MKTMTIASNQERAIFFEGSGLSQKLKFMFNIDNEFARQREKDFNQDRSGRSTSRVTAINHKNMKQQSSKEQSLNEFSKNIADKIGETLKENKADRLILVSPPSFLGKLRFAMDKKLSDLVVDEITLDHAHLSFDELNDKLNKLVHL